jgi:hypothetical protein
MVYIEFSARQNISKIVEKCEKELGTRLTLNDFYNGFFKPYGTYAHKKDNGSLTFSNARIKGTNEKCVMINCFESGVCYHMGKPVDNFVKCDNYSTDIIYYDLLDIEGSVKKFIETTRIPEFFFWKAILKNNQEPFNAKYEKFGDDMYIDMTCSEIWNCGHKIVLKNSHFHTESENANDLVVVEKEEKFDKLLDGITKLVESFKK